MPTYDYVCGACGYGFRKFQQMTEDHLKQCPNCGKPALKRKIGTGAGIIFKGSGFYCTDFAHNGVSPTPEKKTGEKESPAVASPTPEKHCCCGACGKKQPA